MTITETTTRQVFSGVGSGPGSQFTIRIPYYDDTDLVVEKETSGVTLTLTNGVDYTLTGGNGSGGTITMTAAVGDSSNLVVYRQMPQTQEIDLENQDTILPSAIEEALDRLVMLLLDTDDSSTRSVKADDGEINPTGLRMPDLATRANQLCGWDGTGEITAISPDSVIPDEITVTAFMETFLGYSNAFDARQALGIYHGLNSAKGSASPANKLFFTTDTLEVYISDGAAWNLMSASQETVVKSNLIINGSAQINQRVTCNSGSTYPNNDYGFCLDHVLLLSDTNGVATVEQDTADAPDGGSHCFKIPVATSNKKFGLMFPIDSGRAAALFASGNDRKCSVRFKYKRDSGTNLSNIRVAVLSWQSTADAMTDPIDNAAWGAAGANPTWNANWTLENTPANIPVTTSWQTKEITDIAIDTASSNNVALFIWVDDTDCVSASDVLYLADIWLNEGDALSPYRRPTFHEEYDACMRFMQKSFPYGTMPAQNAGLPGAQTLTLENTTESYAVGTMVAFPIPMRASPTLTFYNPAAANDSWRNVSDGDDEGAVTALHPCDSGFYCQAANRVATSAGDILAVHYDAVAEITA